MPSIQNNEIPSLFSYGCYYRNHKSSYLRIIIFVKSQRTLQVLRVYFVVEGK